MSQLIPKVKSGDWQSVVLFADVITKAIAPTSNFITNDFIINGSIVITGLTTSRLIMTNANKELVSLAAITAPLDLTGTTLSHLTTAGYIHLPAAGTANQILKNSGVAGTGAWGTVTENSGALAAISTISMSGQLTNTLAIGTSPFAITSTTVNTNLNADLLDGQHASSFLTAEADTLATVVARGANAGATINVGVGNTLTLAAGSITDSSGAISFGNENLTTEGIIRTTTNVLIGALTYPAKIEYASSETYKISSAFKAGSSFNCYFDAANYSNTAVASGIYFNRTSGTPAGVSNQYLGIYGGSIISVASGANKYWVDGLQFSVSNNADLAAGTGKVNIDYVHRGIAVDSQMGFSGKTISGKANCLNYGIITSATLAGTFNSTVASNNYGGNFSTVDSITDGTGNITSYGCYINACAGRTFASGGVLTSWGLYEVNGRNNAILGPISIGKLTAPTVPLDVVGAILNTTTIEAGTGFKCGGTAAVADGTYTTGIGGTTNGTITVKGGIITAVQQAVA